MPRPRISNAQAIVAREWPIPPCSFAAGWPTRCKMGSVVPSSSALCDRIVRHTRHAHDEVVVELGAGTGVISRALLASGLPPDRLIVVEIVTTMGKHLPAVLPGVMG